MTLLHDHSAADVSTHPAARAWHQLNHEHHGHVSVGIVADPAGDGFIGVMDVRKQLAEMKAANDALRKD